jgi:hypothetical protein
LAEVCALMVKLGEAPDPCPRPDYEDHVGNPFLPHFDLLGRVYTLPGFFTFSEGLFDDGNPDDPSVGFLGIYDEFSTGISRIQVAPDLILPHRHGAAAGHLLVRKTPECFDGIDNDHDGAVDGADAQCIAGAAVEQQALCGLGPELMGVLIWIAARRRGLGLSGARRDARSERSAVPSA